MTDKQIIGGRGSAKPYTTLNTIEVMLENEKLKSELKRKEQECERLKELLNEGYLHNLTLMTEQRVLLQTLTEIKEIADTLRHSTNYDSEDDVNADLDKILQKCEVLDE